MRLLAPAKLNLHLRVGPPRPDGFHPLLTWMCTVDLFDELTIDHHDRLELGCDDPSLSTGPDNLVHRAAMALSANVKIHLQKRIPPGGGLAGGSSDAARALLGINRLCNLALSAAELTSIASRLGSDIAFFLSGPSSICTGLGEKVTATPAPSARWALLIFPPFPMPTPAVYRRFDEMKLGRPSNIDSPPDFTALAQLPAQQLMKQLINHLEPPAFDLNPRLAELRNDCETRLARAVRMSGSGSTLFTLYDSQPEAVAAAAALTLPTRAVELAPTIHDDLATPDS